MKMNNNFPIQQLPAFLQNRTYTVEVPIDKAGQVNFLINNQNFLDTKQILSIQYISIINDAGTTFQSVSPSNRPILADADARKAYLTLVDDEQKNIHFDVPLKSLSPQWNGGRVSVFEPFNVKLSNCTISILGGAAAATDSVVLVFTYRDLPAGSNPGA